MHLHFADFAALVAYFVIVALIGVWTARRVQSMDDFIMPRRFGWVMMTFFGFGSGTHSDQAVTVASKTYTDGASGIWYQWNYLFATPFYWLIAPMMRRFRALTTADVFDLRYGRSVAMLFAVVGMMQYAVNIGVMLKGSSAVIEGSTGGLISANSAIPVITVLFVAYGVAGGLHAAVLTDFIQGVLTIVFSFLLLPFVFDAIGGLSALQENLPEKKLALVASDGISVFFVSVITFNALVGIVAQPHLMANCGAGRTEADGQIGFVAGNLLKRVCTIAWTLTGLAGIVYFAAQGRADIHPDKVFGAIAHDFLPQVMHGLLGLFIAGLLASVMSSCDAFMISTSGLFTENIYKQFVPNRSKRHYLIAARISAVMIVAAGVAFAYSLESVPKGLETFWKIAAMLGIAFWLGLFWRGMTTAGAWTTTLVAFAVLLLTGQEFFAEFLSTLPGGEWLGLTYVDVSVTTKAETLVVNLPWQMIFYLTAGAVSGIVVSWFTRPIDKERLDRYYALVRTPVLPGELPDKPCTLPPGVEPAPARKLIPAKNFEILVPSTWSIIGFLACWVGVAALIGAFAWLTS